MKAQQGPELPRALKRIRKVRKTSKTKLTKHPVGLLKQHMLSSLSKSDQIPGEKVSDCWDQQDSRKSLGLDNFSSVSLGLGLDKP